MLNGQCVEFKKIFQPEKLYKKLYKIMKDAEFKKEAIQQIKQGTQDENKKRKNIASILSF